MRRPPSAPSTGRLGRWAWSPVAAAAIVAAGSLLALAAVAAVDAAPAQAVAARTRDEDVRPDRFLPLAVVLAGGVGVVWSARRRDARAQRWFAIGAALLTT